MVTDIDMVITMAKKSTTKRRVLEILLAIFLIIIALFLFAFAYYWNKLSLIQFDDGTIKSEDTIYEEATEPVTDENGNEESTTSKKVDSDSYLANEEDLAKLSDNKQEIVPPTVNPVKDEKVVNILLIATDEADTEFSNIANSDCMMLISADKAKGTIKLVSIERGTAVPIQTGRYAGQYDWINAMLRLGGPAMLVETVEECFRVDIEGFVRVNSQTFIQIVNSCGGININLTQTEADYLNLKLPGSTVAEGHIKQLGIEDKLQTVKAGPNFVNGEMATLYARCRIIDDDWHRIGRQRKVIQSAISSTRGLSVSELNLMLDKVLPLVQTNLTKGQITELLFSAPKFANATVSEMSLPVNGTYSLMVGMYGKNMYSVDFDANAKALQQFLYK